MGDTLLYNPNEWMDCLVAYIWHLKNPDLKIEATDMILDLTFEKEYLQREDGTYPEIATILFDQKDQPVCQYLIEGFNLAEIDPASEGGKMFWEHMLNSEELTKKALEEGQAVGKWDALRQVMNMGQIAYMTKVNAALSYYRKWSKDESKWKNNVERLLGAAYLAAVEDVIKKESEE